VNPAPRRKNIAEHGTGDRAERESGDTRDSVDDYRPRRANHVGRRRAQLPHPHHVEQDVENAAVQPSGAQHGPPAIEVKDGNGARRAEAQQRHAVRREKRHHPAHLDPTARSEQRQRVEDDADAGDGFRESEIGAEPAQHGREPPQPRVPAPAAVTALVVDADQVSAGGTDDRSGALTIEHSLQR
jgi:hypothetical protein